MGEASLRDANRETGELVTAARRWYDAGYCVVPSHQDRSKRPHSKWAEYQIERPTWSQVSSWLEDGTYTGIGVICGAVSGNVEMLEIEGPAVAAGAIDRLMEQAKIYEMEELLRRVFVGCSERSAGGGLHLFVRVSDGPAMSNTKLAYDPAGRKVIAETRGEGGFAIVAPTPGRTGHAQGSRYEFLTKGPEATADVTSDERDQLHLLMTLALDERVEATEPEAVPQAARVERDGKSPGDVYNATHTWEEILIPLGWARIGAGTRNGHEIVFWRRPEKNEGFSASTGGPGDHLYVFSTSTEFPAEQPLSKFAVYTILNHGGDFKAAAAQLMLENPREAKGSLQDLTGSFSAPEPSETLGDTFSDLGWVLTGERRTPPAPEHLTTDTGGALFYRGRINGLFGDPETAKSWIAMAAVTEALHHGQTAVYLDIDHNGADEIASRLLLLGAPGDTLANPDRFRIYEPEDRAGLLLFTEQMYQYRPDIVVIDSLGELMPMLGLKSIDNDELTIAIRSILKPLAHKIGATVITIDHLPKGQEARSSGYAIGGIAKKRAIDGIYLSCDAIQAPAPGTLGKIRLTIEKDRHGHVRAQATGRIAGDFILDSTRPDYTITRIEHPATSSDGKIKPTGAMEAISKYLTSLDQWTAPSRNSILTTLGETTSFKRHTLDRAIDELKTDKYLALDPAGPGKPQPVRLTRPYYESGLQDATNSLK